MKYIGAFLLCLLVVVATVSADKCEEEHKECMKKAKYMRDKLNCIRQRVKCIAGKLGEKVKPGKSCMQKCNQDHANLMDRVKCYRNCVSVGDEMEIADELFDAAQPTCTEKQADCLKLAQDYSERFKCYNESYQCNLKKIKKQLDFFRFIECQNNNKSMMDKYKCYQTCY